MGLREYAKHRNVSLKAVQKAIAEHRIECVEVGGHQKIDPEHADKLWLERTSKPKATKNSDIESYHKSKAEKEHFLAKHAELDYRARVGELLETNDVKNTIEKLNSITRQHLLNIPDQAAPELMAMTNIHDITSYLYSQINTALESLVRDSDLNNQVTTDDLSQATQTT